MNQTLSPDAPSRKLNQQLALNLTAALLVAGPARAGKPNKLRQIDVMRRTRMSRSTLRPLLDTAGSCQRNPDLGTLQKLAQTIGVPIAFMLMTPSDWRALIQAVSAIPDFQEAANRMMTDTLGKPELVEAVLKECDVHPERPPIGAAHDAQELERLNARNEWRRRSGLAMAALAQPAARGERSSFVVLTALAAALANQMTPYNPGA